MSAPTELLRKLQVKSGARLLLINVPQAIADELTAGAEVEPVHLGDPHDGAIAFCGGPVEVAAYTRQVLDGLPEDGLLWFAYRKGAAGKRAGLTRDTGWQALQEAGYEPVRSISFDDEWMGLRFRRSQVVKGRGGEPGPRGSTSSP